MAKNKLLITLLVIVVIGIGGGLLYQQLGQQAPTAASDSTATGGAGDTQFTSVTPAASPATPGDVSASPTADKQPSNPNPDLAADASGLSKATVIMSTNQGVIRFKFYPNDAPNTVARIVTLINQGFYNGLTFHRVVPGFVVQGGDPQGNGTGGSGQKLQAEFNERRHVEGTVAMARAADPNSADSQFYIALGPQPHLDRNYTVFGQVIEGMDVVRRLQMGDKMQSVIIE